MSTGVRILKTKNGYDDRQSAALFCNKLPQAQMTNRWKEKLAKSGAELQSLVKLVGAMLSVCYLLT